MKTYTGRSGTNLHEGTTVQILKNHMPYSKQRGGQKTEHLISIFRICLNAAVPKIAECL